jgi:hypothetical protein
MRFMARIYVKHTSLSREKCDFRLILCGFSANLQCLKNRTGEHFHGHPITERTSPRLFLRIGGQWHWRGP